MRWKTSPCSAARFARPRRPSSADGSGRATSASTSAAKMTRAFAGCSIGPISSTSPAAAFSRTKCCGGEEPPRRNGPSVPQPDPRPAILAFHRELAALGITLIVMPTPVKPGVHPENLVASYPPDGGTAQNASYARVRRVARARRHRPVRSRRASWKTDADQACSTSPATRTGGPRRWSSSRSASRRSSSAARSCLLAGAAGYRIEEQEITNQGDTAAMLDLPTGQRLYPPERVVISRVLNADGSAWRSDRAADVLVLGDSFSNIYSLASMGWGDAAGLVEQSELRARKAGRSDRAERRRRLRHARDAAKSRARASRRQARRHLAVRRARARGRELEDRVGVRLKPQERVRLKPDATPVLTNDTRSILLPTRHSNS